MANTLITPTWVLRSISLQFRNEVNFIGECNRSLDDQFSQSGAKVGDTVKARLPNRFQAKDGEALQVQDLYDQTVPITLNARKHIGFTWSLTDQALSIEDTRQRYVNPAARSLGSAFDYLAFSNVYYTVYNSVGTPGTTPTSPRTYSEAVAKIRDMSSSMPLAAVLDNYAMMELQVATSTLFNPTATQSETWRTGQVSGLQLGIAAWYTDSNRVTHSTGTFTASTPLVNAASQTGSSLITDGWASGASSLKKGDVFTVAGVNSVNRLNYQDTGRLQQFVVQADISDTAGAMTISISPSIITSGQLQTVSASPADNAAITVLGASSATSGTLATTSSPQSMVFVRGAQSPFVWVGADLARPAGGAEAQTIRDTDFGMALQWVRDFDVRTYNNLSRLDGIGGAAALLPEHACRVWG